MKTERGFSLIEAVVALFVGSLLLGGITLVLVYSLRYLGSALVYHDVQRQAELAVAALSADLGETNPGSIQRGTSPDYALMLSPRRLRTDPNSHLYTYRFGRRLEWHTWVAYYREAGELRRAEMATSGGPKVIPPMPPAPTLTSMRALTGPALRVVARHLTELNVSSGSSTESWRVRVTVREPINSSKWHTLTLDRQVRVRH